MWMGTNVFHSRATRANLSSQNVVKYLGNVLFALLKKQNISSAGKTRTNYHLLGSLLKVEMKLKTKQVFWALHSPTTSYVLFLPHHKKASSVGWV